MTELHVRPNMPSATIYSDDRVFEFQFNPVNWLVAATSAEIVALAECGWGGDYPADAVAYHVGETNEDVRAVLTYCTRKRGVGFEVHVDKSAALEWLSQNRPDVADAIDASKEG